MRAEEHNIVLIVIDTLRNGIINFHQLKYNDVSFFKEFTIYENCVTAAPWTIPSHVSLFTGKYPSEHRIHVDREHKLSLEFSPTELEYRTIFQILKKKDTQTMAFQGISV